MGKTIGIIGGMGPMATSDIFQKIVASTEAMCDNDHIRIVIECNPAIPDRTEAILYGGLDPVAEMAKTIETVSKCGVDCLIIPCNTAHYYLDRLEPLTDVPIISILDVTAKACAKKYPSKKAALFGTKGTIQSGVYEAALKKEGIDFIIPEPAAQDRLMECIYAFKAGEDISSRKETMEHILSESISKGSDYFILGCSELPVIVEMLRLSVDFIDPTQELAEAAIRFCGYRVKGNV